MTGFCRAGHRVVVRPSKKKKTVEINDASQLRMLLPLFSVSP